MSHKIQSIIFEKRYWTIPRATEWLNLNHHKSHKVDEKENYYRFRQFDPIKGKHYETLPAKDMYGKVYQSIKFIYSY